MNETKSKLVAAVREIIETLFKKREKNAKWETRKWMKQQATG